MFLIENFVVFMLFWQFVIEHFQDKVLLFENDIEIV